MLFNIQIGSPIYRAEFDPTDERYIYETDGEAGLRFTPAQDFHGQASFAVQASLSADDNGLGGDIVTAIITVNPR